jgi:hypothetical protein
MRVLRRRPLRRVVVIVCQICSPTLCPSVTRLRQRRRHHRLSTATSVPLLHRSRRQHRALPTMNLIGECDDQSRNNSLSLSLSRESLLDGLESAAPAAAAPPPSRYRVVMRWINLIDLLARATLVATQMTSSTRSQPVSAARAAAWRRRTARPAMNWTIWCVDCLALFVCRSHCHCSWLTCEMKSDVNQIIVAFTIKSNSCECRRRSCARRAHKIGDLGERRWRIGDP